MDLTAAQPYYVLGMIPPEDMPFIACNELDRDREGASLLELASLSRPTWRDIGTLVDRALEEVCAPSVSREQAWRKIAVSILDQVVTGALALKDAGYQLAVLSGAADYPVELHPLYALDDYLELNDLTDEEWEKALTQELRELRSRLTEGLRPGRTEDDEYGLGLLY